MNKFQIRKFIAWIGLSVHSGHRGGGTRGLQEQAKNEFDPRNGDPCAAGTWVTDDEMAHARPAPGTPLPVAAVGRTLGYTQTELFFAAKLFDRFTWRDPRQARSATFGEAESDGIRSGEEHAA